MIMLGTSCSQRRNILIYEFENSIDFILHVEIIYGPEDYEYAINLSICLFFVPYKLRFPVEISHSSLNYDLIILILLKV